MAGRRIELNSDGFRHSVTIDGVDVSKAVSGADFSLHVGDIPRLTLDVVVLNSGVTADIADVRIPDATAEVLISLGWKPPRGGWPSGRGEQAR